MGSFRGRLQTGRRVRRDERTPVEVGRRPARAFGRSLVLSALVVVTAVVPVAHAAIAQGRSVTDLMSTEEMPSTVAALTALPGQGQVPASLQAAGAEVDRDMDAASRELERDEILPGCDGLAPEHSSPNGQVPDTDLCVLWDGRTRVRADFAFALVRLNEAYVARFGADLCMTSGYRSLADQRRIKAQRGYWAATPGTSNHGYGLAVDFCTDQLSTSRYNWLRDVGPNYGIDNPLWARTTKIERWHWEYTDAVESETGGASAD